MSLTFRLFLFLMGFGLQDLSNLKFNHLGLCAKRLTQIDLSPTVPDVTRTNFFLASASLHTAIAVEGLQVMSCQIMHGLQSSLGERKVWEQCEQAQPGTSTNCWYGRWNTKAEEGRGEWKCVLVWKRPCKNKYAWTCLLGM